MKKKIIGGGVALAIVIVSLTVFKFLNSTKANPSKKKKTEIVYGVKCTEVNYVDKEVPFSYPGRVNSNAVVQLGVEVQGRLLEGDVSLKEGKSFKKGTVLFRIFSQDYKASVTAAKSRFLKSLSNVLADVYIDFPEEYEKWNTFFTQVEVDKKLPLLPAIKSVKEKVYMSSKNILGDYYDIRKMEIMLSKYVVRAPFDGAYVSVNKEVGSIASPSATIANIIRTDTYEVVVPLLPVDAEKVKIHDKVMICMKDGNSFPAYVARKAAFVDRKTQSQNIYISYRGHNLFDGEYVSVKFGNNMLKQVLQVPRESVYNGHQMYVVNDGHIHKEDIVVKYKNDDYMFIQGLKEQQVVVVESLIRAYDGMKINPLLK